MLEWSLSDSLITLLQQRQQLQRWFRILGARDARRRRRQKTRRTRRGECEIGDGVLGEWETATHSCLLMKKIVKRWECLCMNVLIVFFCFFTFLWLEEASLSLCRSTRNKWFSEGISSWSHTQCWPPSIETCGKTGNLPFKK